MKAKSAQQFVPIKEVRESILVLKDGSFRMVLMASSLNFALKSQDEQTAIIMQYQNFLNSLDFSIQFFIQSEDLNINPYIETLKEAQKEQVNELLKIQIREYMEFIKNFVSSTNIVSKTFYIVIPYSPGGLSGADSLRSLGRFFGKKSSVKKSADEDGKFLENKLQIQQRADIVIGGLSSIGLRVAPLNTEELIELFFKLFNPGEIKGKMIQSQNEKPKI